MARISKAEQEKAERRHLRLSYINDTINYRKDYEAIKRVAKINEDYSKLDRDYLSKEEENKLKERYPLLQNLTKGEKLGISLLVEAKKYRDNYIQFKQLNKYIDEETIWLNAVVWDYEEMEQLYNFLIKVGVNTIYYTEHSTGTLDDMVWLHKLGAKIVDTVVLDGDREGLVFKIC